MLRIVVEILLPLLTPITLYALWTHVDAKRTGKGMPSWEEGHWFWVILLGGALAIATVVFFGTRGEHRSGIYVPPHVGEKGVVVPGQFK
jgi:hypothetical protein